VEDVGFAIEMLNNLEPRAPLNLADDLCDYSRNLLQNQLKIHGNMDANNVDENDAAAGPLSNDKDSKDKERKRKQLLKAQQKQLIKKYSKVKQMTIDYYCREDLTVTTLKEFFEIFISSLKKEQAFHQELTSHLYQHIGVSMKFDPCNTQATLTIFLGGLS